MSNSDLRVSVSLGMTMPVPGVDYANVKPEIRIDGIDPAGDVLAQVVQALAASEVAFVEVDRHVEVVLSQLLAPHTNDKTLHQMLGDVQAALTNHGERLNTLTTKLREHLVDKVETEIAAGNAGE